MTNVLGSIHKAEYNCLKHLTLKGNKMAATATATSKTTTYNDIPKGRGVRIFE